MSFLSLAFLAALPLAAAPLLLHWFDRHRNVTLSWGAMQFLMEALQHQSRARRLQEWWLLVMRMLAIVCLILALARPLAQTSWLAPPHQTETVVVLDNSLSMQRQIGEQSAFEVAIHQAKEVVDSRSPGSPWRLLLTAPYPHWVSSAESVGARETETGPDSDFWESLQPTLASGDLLSALVMAIQEEPFESATQRRILILSDDQAVDWHTQDTTAWEHLAARVRQSPLGLTIEQRPVLPKSPRIRNAAIQQVASAHPLIGVHQPCVLTAVVENAGEESLPACQLLWRLGDEVLSTQSIPALDVHATHTATCEVRFADKGLRKLTCELDVTDDLLADHRDTLIVDVVDELPVLIVDANLHQAGLQQDSLFLQTALGWVDGERVDQSSVFVPTVIDLTQFAHMDLSSYHAVIIPQVTELNADQLRNLQEYVEEGGGLWLAAGPRTDLDQFNALLFNESQGLSPWPLDRILDETEDSSRRVTLNPQLSQHPAVRLLADQKKLDTAEIGVHRRFRFLPPDDDLDISVLLSLSNGEAVAIEQSVGRGRVIVQGVPLRWEWSELVRSEAFVVLVEEWLTYLTEARITRHNLAPGEPLSLAVQDVGVSQATLRLPTGAEVELTADLVHQAHVFRTSRTLLPGDYGLEVGLSGDEILFHVHRDHRESDLRPLTSDQQRQLAELLSQPVVVDSQREITLAATANPLWPLLWLCLILLMVLELWLSHRMSRSRFGLTTIREFESANHPADLKLTTMSGRRGRLKSRIEPPSVLPAESLR